MDDLKTACPVCGRQEKSTLRHDGAIENNGTVAAHCIQCDWKGSVLIKAELGHLEQEQLACTKEHHWDKKTLPVIHVDADFVDDTNLLNCPNCGHTWSLGPDV